MKFLSYVKDQILFLIFFCLMIFVSFLLLVAFKSPKELTISLLFLFVITFVFLFFFQYFRKKQFFDEFLLNLERLDQKYFILETIERPEFYEGKLFYDVLYEINKSMIENVFEYKMSMIDFKEYIEMWIHEVKIPIASFMLMFHNQKEKTDKRFLEQMSRIENYIEQVLYYVRSENAEKDYIIKENDLSKIVHEVVLKNKDSILEQNIELVVEDLDKMVLTDSKWLVFVLNQILNNSIKYHKNGENPIIRISCQRKKEQVVLSIYDNGIGIPKSDLSRVFDKTFTGSNGRKMNQSTGMGLYITKKLCQKLGHKIEIQSKEKEYTRVTITFQKEEYYSVTKGKEN